VVIDLTVKLENCPIFGVHEITECRMAKIKKVGFLEFMAYKIAKNESKIGLGVICIVSFGIFLIMV